MERGERENIIVLSVIGVISVMAALALYAQNPTGQVMQDQSIYPMESVGLACGNAVFLGWDSGAAVYCCVEDMNGANECATPHRILRVK